MPLTQLDKTAALIVIDLQKGVVNLPVPTAHPISGIVTRTAQLAHAFREHGLPVVLVNVTARPRGRSEAPVNFSPPPDWTELVPELDQQPSDYIVSKQCTGAFAGTSLQDILSKRGVTQVFLAGLSTSIGVESTARHAYDLGYHVVLVSDAMTDRDDASHRHSFEKIFPRLGQIDTTENLLSRLESA